MYEVVGYSLKQRPESFGVYVGQHVASTSEEGVQNWCCNNVERLWFGGEQVQKPFEPLNSTVLSVKEAVTGWHGSHNIGDNGYNAFCPCNEAVKGFKVSRFLVTLHTESFHEFVF